MDISWGRKITRSKGHSDAFMRIIAIGCLMLLIFTASITPADGEYIEAISNETIPNESKDAIGDRFGYFQEKWNLWEYIGDFVSSLLYSE